MNDMNRIVFEVYQGVAEMDYTKNEKKSLKKSACKAIRYVLSGYLFSMREVRKKLSEPNVFSPVDDVFPEARIAVYTVSTGKYDKIKEPIYVDSHIDYFVFTEQEIPSDSAWKRINIPEGLKEGRTSLEQARYIKSHPHEFFKKYDVSIFIDGNIRITCDIKPLVYTMMASGKKMAIHRHQVRNCVYQEAKAIFAAGKASLHDMNKQMKSYKKAGFPKGFGLFETNVIIREHNNEDCINIMNTWWREMDKHTKRDQLSFTYALWVNGKTSDYVLSLGNNSRRNPYFIVDSHR